MAEWRIKCGGSRHRIVFEGGAYSAPDHTEEDALLDAIAGRQARCKDLAKRANESLVTSDPVANMVLTRHVQAQAIERAERFLEAAELPFEAGTIVALRWTGPDSNATSGALSTTPYALHWQPTDDRWLINRDLCARKALGDMHAAAERFWDQARQGNRGMGYGLTVRSDGNMAVVALYDGFKRALLWRAPAKRSSKYNQAIDATKCRWAARATDKRYGKRSVVMLANFVAGLLAAYKHRVEGHSHDGGHWRCWRDERAVREMEFARAGIPAWLDAWAQATCRYNSLTCDELRDHEITDRAVVGRHEPVVSAP
jgi:hypothetical protein